MGTNEPDSLFLGITKPDFAVNMDIFELLLAAEDAVAGTVVWTPEGSIVDRCSTFVLILVTTNVQKNAKQTQIKKKSQRRS